MQNLLIKLETKKYSYECSNIINLYNAVDRYGFSYAIAEFYKIKRRNTKGDWIHGWIWWSDLELYDFFGNEIPRKNARIVVGNQNHKNFLNSKGFTKVYVGGLPFAYVPTQSNERLKSSLILIPNHSAEWATIDLNLENFIKENLDIINNYKHVAVLIHSEDINEKIINLLSKFKINYIVGANPKAKNSLIRTRLIFDSFEDVLSNVMGSHIIYALASGCRVKLRPNRIKDIVNIKYLNENINENQINKFFSRIEYIYNIENIKIQFPELLNENSSKWWDDKNLGEFLIGTNYVMNKKDIVEALGWNAKGACIDAINIVSHKIKLFIKKSKSNKII
jgi:hypothetical protein